MNTMQTDVGRQTKILVIGGIAATAAAGYVLLTYFAAASAKQSSVGAIQVARGSETRETEHYGEVLGRYNRQNADAAAETGDTYLSVLSSKSQTVPDTASPQPRQTHTPQPALAQLPPATPHPSPQYPPADPKQQERIAEQTQGLLANWAAVPHSAARVSQVADYAKSLVRTSAGESGTAAPALPQQRIVAAFALAPAILETDIDTDETSMVSAYIPSGPYADARVFAMGYKRLNETVDMTFTYMEWNGRAYKINAKAIDKDSMRSALSGEVNNRYLSRIFVPALAIGLGKAGQLYEQQNSQTIITPLGSVIQTQSGPPTGRAVAGAFVGGLAHQAGQVLTHDAAQMAIKQVLIPKNETIGVRFIEAVLTSSEISSGASAPAAGETPRLEGGGAPAMQTNPAQPGGATALEYIAGPAPGQRTAKDGRVRY